MRRRFVAQLTDGDGSFGRGGAAGAGAGHRNGHGDGAHHGHDQRRRIFVPGLAAGDYKVTVTASGFPNKTVDKVVVDGGNDLHVAGQVAMAQQSTAVEVSAAAVTLDTTTQTQTMTHSGPVVQDMPLNGRDFSQLIAVSPGYGGYSVGGFGSLNGTRANQMNWQIDGTDNNDFWHNIPAVNQGGVSGIAGVVMPIDAIDEFSAQTQSNAEAGRNAGGTVNLVIKSGGNELTRQRLLLQPERILRCDVAILRGQAGISESSGLRN